MINLNSKIYVSGHTGLVGSAILRRLKKDGYKKLIFAKRSELDLTNQKKVLDFIKRKKPDFIFIAAAKVGGILDNDNDKAKFIYENLVIQTNLIHSAFLCGIKNLIFLGSSCVYPRLSKQPIKEDYLLEGKLEKTNDAYAVAKIAGIKMCESYNFQYKTNYKCLMPTNTFGPNDNYNKFTSHFLPALIRKAHQVKLNKQKNLVLWGDGRARREVIYVDDLADACVFFMKKKTKYTLINIGTGRDYRIREYAKIILKIVVPDKIVKIKYDRSKPNGTPRKLLDISLAQKYGWKSSYKLSEAIKKTYLSYLKDN
tara:strand:+ start:115 stop:1050 length:936 start_codon:yes stop_codon:yes gene_type:complete